MTDETQLSLRKAKIEYDLAYTSAAKLEQEYKEAQALLNQRAEALAAVMLDLGIKSLELPCGTVKPKARYHGTFNLENMPQVINYLKNVGLENPVKIIAQYEVKPAQVEGYEEFKQQHPNANKLSTMVHHASFDKLLREHPSLLDYANYQQSVTAKTTPRKGAE